MLNMNLYHHQNDEIIELNNQLLMEIIHRLDLNYNQSVFSIQYELKYIYLQEDLVHIIQVFYYN
jgi:hypothetical protein